MVLLLRSMMKLFYGSFMKGMDKGIVCSVWFFLLKMVMVSMLFWWVFLRMVFSVVVELGWRLCRVVLFLMSCCVVKG